MASRTKAKPKASAKRSSARSASPRRRPRAQSRGRAAPSRRRAATLGGLAVAQMVPADGISLLELDHREVLAWFEQFEQLEDAAEKELLALKICLALMVHAEVEETIFYPNAREVTDADDKWDEAVVEHASAKELIAQIQTMEAGDRLYDARVRVLGEYVRHHIREEETELFPMIRDSELDLYDLGAKLAEAKVDLLVEFTSE